MRARALFVACSFALLTAVPGCSFFAPTESKVRAGELFETAHPKYDPYFRDVHQAQLEANAWEEQKRSSRRPLVDALKLDPDAAAVTVVQATHERMLGIAREAGNVHLDVVEGQGRVVVQNTSKVDDASRSFIGAIETCVHNESERAKALRNVPPRVDALVKQGRDLEPQVRDDLERRGGRMPKLVLEELQASYDVLGEISKEARLEAREADDFIADLRRAVGTDIAESAARPSAKSAPAPKTPKAAEPARSKPAPAPVDAKPKPVAETPKPKPPTTTSEPPPKKAEEAPKPPPKAQDEFNP